MESKRHTILLGCVTHDSDRKFLDQFMNALQDQDCQDIDLLFVDNSDGDEYFTELEKTDAQCFRDTLRGSTIERITRGRNAIRKHALEKGYEYLFFVDTDIVLPRFAVSRLLSEIKSGKEVVCGVYLSELSHQGHKFVAPVLFDFGDEDSGLIYNISGVMRDRVVEVAASGFGCMMMTRKVMQEIEYRYSKESQSGEDFMFCLDARARGFKIYCDTSVKCDHYGYPPGDARNEKQMWKSYLSQRSV
jgi:glycosyltransferase involved in cell wall biosynthesis